MVSPWLTAISLVVVVPLGTTRFLLLSTRKGGCSGFWSELGSMEHRGVVLTGVGAGSEVQPVVAGRVAGKWFLG